MRTICVFMLYIVRLLPNIVLVLIELHNLSNRLHKLSELNKRCFPKQ